MSNASSRFLLLALTLVAALAPPARAAAPPTNTIVLHFDGDGVTATGVTPHGEAIFFSVGVQSSGYDTQVGRTQAIVADDDGDGVVQFVVPSPGHVSPTSCWAVVDLGSGASVVGGPRDEPRAFRVAPEHSYAVHASGTGNPVAGESIAIAGQSVEGLVIRPGSAVWALSAYDGGAGDTDHQNDGTITVDPAAMESVRGGPPPAELSTGDVMVLIDSGTLRLNIETIGR